MPTHDDDLVHLVATTSVDDLEPTYRRLELDRVDDTRLVAAVAAVISEPREGPADSFVLHAPLELTARARLLARTPSELRRLARLRLMSIAARYQAHEPATLQTEPGRASIDALILAVDDGDLAGAEASARALAGRAASMDLMDGLGRLGAAIADRTSAAAHGPILLAMLAESPDRAIEWLTLARPLVRELARRPDWRITWIGSATSAAPRPADPDALFAALADPPRLGVPGSSFIHPLLMQVDAPGVADVVLGPIVGPGSRVTVETERAITRAAALSMVRDDPEHAPYGWTHSLTIPQAVLTIAPLAESHGARALAIAATQLLAFRAAHGEVTLRTDDPLLTTADPATQMQRRRALVVQSARRHDAHIAKYVLAVLTAAERDPEASELYLTAGEHLLAVWDGLGDDPDDVLADVADQTPTTI